MSKSKPELVSEVSKIAIIFMPYLTSNVYPCFVLKPRFTRVTTEGAVLLITRQSPS